MEETPRYTRLLYGIILRNTRLLLCIFHFICLYLPSPPPTPTYRHARLTCSSCGVLARRSPFCLFWSLRHCRPTRPVSLTQLVVPRTVLVLSPPRYLYCLSVLRLPGNHRINVSVCSRRPTLVVLSHQSICLFSFILLVLFHRCICPVSLTQPFLSHRFTCPSRSLYP